jgi:hypothetical protein
MLRLALTLSLAMHVAFSTSEASVFEKRVCAQSCPDDDFGGNCAPDCADCMCCPHLRVIATAAESKFQLPSGPSRAPEWDVWEPLSPDPGEILHVPKVHLA